MANEETNNNCKEFHINSKHHVYMSRESKERVETRISEVILKKLYKEHYLSQAELTTALASLYKQ